MQIWANFPVALVLAVPCACFHGESSTGHEGHPHGDDAAVVEDGGHEHVPRDPLAEPCTEDNWRALGTDLRQCSLAGANLSGQNLRRFDLTDADLTGANLAGADLFNSTCVRAKLEGALLDGANLAGADFREADLRDASLRAANLTSSIFDGASIEGLSTNEYTICPNGNPGPCF